MTKLEKVNELLLNKAVSTRSTWAKGVYKYALELLQKYFDEVGEDAPCPTEKDLLNGAYNWLQYSEGGCALITNREIASRLCTPSRFRRLKEGELPPNSSETWLQVQAHALWQASQRIKEAIKEVEGA